jgi:hypothetical protein
VLFIHDGGSDAAFAYSVGRLVGRFGKQWIWRCCRVGKNPAGANVNGHELHDGLQLPSRVVPNQLRHTWIAADGRRDRYGQCQCEHDVSAQLRDAAGFLSDDLRTDVPVTVIWPRQ